MLAWKELHGWKLDYLCSLHGSSSNVIFVPWKHSLDIVIWCKEPAKASFLSYTFEKKNFIKGNIKDSNGQYLKISSTWRMLPNL